MRAKLERLRHEAGRKLEPGRPDRLAPAPSSSNNSAGATGTIEFRRRLARLRPRGLCKLAGTVEVDEHRLAEFVRGRRLAPGLVLVATRIDRDSRHGDSPLGSVRLPLDLAALSGRVPAPRSPIFMDTETTGLAGGTGTIAWLLGLARVDGDHIELRQYLLTGIRGEREMLRDAARWMAGADGLVTFNGKSFDRPLLAGRCRLAGVRDPFAPLWHVDLLHPLRRAFQDRWPDCRLASAEKHILGVRRIGDLSGAEAPQAWFDWMRRGDPSRVPAVIDHNRLDLLSLMTLTTALRACFEDPISWRANVLGVLRSPTHSASFDRFEYLHANRYRLEDDALLELARLARGRRDWSLAVEIWADLAAAGKPAAHERLAKYEEHVRGNLARALAYTRSLCELEPGVARHRIRSARLLRKLKLS